MHVVAPPLFHTMLALPVIAMISMRVTLAMQLPPLVMLVRASLLMSVVASVSMWLLVSFFVSVVLLV